MQVMTNDGHRHMAKQQLGLAEPTVTRVVAGAGFVDLTGLDEREQAALLARQTQVLDPICEMEVGDKALVDGVTVRLPVQLSNLGFTEKRLIRQIGAFVPDPDGGEILYQLVQYEDPVALPAFAANGGGVILFDCELDLDFANAESAEIPPTPDFLVTLPKLRAHDGASEAHPALRAQLGEHDFRIARIENMVVNNVTKNPFTVTFGNLDAVLVEGVWNQAEGRIEF